MNAQELLVDLLEHNRQFYHYHLEGLTIAQLYWQPDPGANSIGAITWHVARVMDLFQTQHIENRGAEEEIWFTGDFAEKTGYDPRGIGDYGWGTLQGYSLEELLAIPQIDAKTLLTYLDAVLDRLIAYLQQATIEEILATAPGFDAKFPVYTWIRAPYTDMTRHLGEIMALKGMWERQQPS